MTKTILVAMSILILFSFNTFAEEEEEEAQTRPNPLMHQQMVSKGKLHTNTRTKPDLHEGKIVAGEEKASYETVPVIKNRVTLKTTRKVPKSATGKLMVPDEEEEETGSVSPATQY